MTAQVLLKDCAPVVRRGNPRQQNEAASKSGPGRGGQPCPDPCPLRLAPQLAPAISVLQLCMRVVSYALNKRSEVHEECQKPRTEQTALWARRGTGVTRCPQWGDATPTMGWLSGVPAAE